MKTNMEIKRTKYYDMFKFKSENMIALEYCEECNLWGEVIDDDLKIKTVLTKEQYMNNCLKEDYYDM